MTKEELAKNLFINFHLAQGKYYDLTNWLSLSEDKKQPWVALADYVINDIVL